MVTNKILPMQMRLKDYERAFKVIHSVLRTAEIDSHVACLLMNAGGALILNKYYKIPCQVVAGTAFLCVDKDTDTVAVIGGMKDGVPFSDRGHFHVWVQSQTHVFDFQAPIFREAMAAHTFGSSLPRLMFQRSLDEDCQGDWAETGDFSLYPNPELTDELVESLFATHIGPDLLQVIDTWFERPPKPLRGELAMADSHGPTKVLKLSNLGVTGAWGR